MKISIITVSNNEIISSEKNDSIKLIASQLYKNGFDVTLNQTIKNQSSIVSNTFKQALELTDCVIFVSDNEFEKSYMCKKIICDCLQTNLVVNSYAKKNIDEYSKNVPLRREDANYAQIPEIARCIKNTLSAFQGFLIEKDNKLIFFLPLAHAELHHMFFSSVLPYILLKEKGKTNTSYVFKTFGIKANEMALLLKELIRNKHNIEVICNEYLLNGEILVTIPKNIKQEVVNNFIGELYSKILPYVYTDKDISMSELIYSILTINNRTLVFAEDFTAGNMTNQIYANLPKAKDILKEGYFVPSDEAKMKLLGVDNKIFKKSLDYEEIAYQMSLGALENSGADIVISNCGNLETGEVTFAIGSSEGVHIYNKKVEGSFEQKITMATNAIFYQLIKKLKQNDFHLGQNVV